jgi:alkylation response protein AidB-like acyl-CoA dehydrogenase
MAIPEEHGGSGATPIELGIVFEEMGATLLRALRGHSRPPATAFTGAG